MSVKEYLEKNYENCSDQDEKTLVLNEIVSFLVEINVNNEKKIIQLVQEKNKFEKQIERAKGLIEDANSEVVKAKKGTINEMKRKLQIARDRIVAISTTADALGKQINNSTEKKMMLTTLNNMISSTGIIYSELLSLGLWDEKEVKPDFTPMNVKEIPTQKKRPIRRKPKLTK